MNSILNQKLQIYLNEYNLLMDKTTYLPLVSGQLQAYAYTKDSIRENYNFMPILFFRDRPEKIVSNYQNPAVAAFSASLWNINLSLTVAQRVKAKFPNCLTVFGGPSVPFEATDFFRTYPFIDVVVRGEGEQTFVNILMRFLETRDFRDIPGISYRCPETSTCIRNDKEGPLATELDIFPSPYLEGIFVQALVMNIKFQALVETNRGCPFPCSYCFWGQGGLSKRFRTFSLDRVKKVVEWCGRNKIEYVFCTDSNFGMLPRDLEIAHYLVETKTKYGFPEKFRACYGKNAEDSIYEIGRLLTKHGLDKGVTLSRQSNSPEALRNVRRKNIKLSIYDNLQKRYNKENIPVYTELILGLPGETYQSFLHGIETTLQSGLKNQLFVYLCQVYPNTELAQVEYQEKFKILTVRIPLIEIHCSVHTQEAVTEYEDVIISTASMPVEDWKRAVVVSLVMQLLHGLKLGFYILAYLVDRYNIKYADFLEYIALLKMRSNRVGILKNEVLGFHHWLDSVLQGNPRGCIMQNFGSIYWEPEEASYLNISNQKDDFYKNLSEVIKEYLDRTGIDYDREELDEVIEYQRVRIINYKSVETRKYYFERNIPEYFDNHFTGGKHSICKKPQIMILSDAKDYMHDKKAFATEVVVRGRKSDRMLYKVKWYNVNGK